MNEMREHLNKCSIPYCGCSLFFRMLKCRYSQLDDKEFTRIIFSIVWLNLKRCITNIKVIDCDRAALCCHAQIWPNLVKVILVIKLSFGVTHSPLCN